MLRAAAKNHRDVTVVCDPNDYARVLAAMSASGGAVDEQLRFDLAVRAFEHTAGYDGAIANYLGARTGPEPAEFPRTLNLQYLQKQTMRYGENPHQKAAFYVEQHNSHLPHSAFKSQTPDEMYFGTGQNIPEQLHAARITAREARMKSNRSQTCRSCAEPVAITCG